MSKFVGLFLLLICSFAYGVCFDDLQSYKVGNCDNAGRPTVVFSCRAENEPGKPIRKQVFCNIPGDPYYESYLSQQSCFAAFGTYVDNLKSCSADGDIPPIRGITYVDNTSNACGSVVRTDNQVLNEYIDLTGIDFPLVYSSEKVRGRKTWNTLNIPVSIFESNYNFPVQANIIEVTVAGKVHSVNFQPSLVSTYEFVWDGLDSNNLPVSSSVNASVFASHDFGDQFCTALVLGVGEHVVLSNSNYGSCGYRFPRTNTSTVVLGSVFLSSLGVGGWDFAIHHKYDELRKTLFLGDGSSFPAWRETKSNGEKWVISKSRSEVFVFLNDLHIRTLDSLTGIPIYEFSYDNSGNLTTISDKYSNVVSILYNGHTPVSITSSRGHVTALEVDSNGYLSKITSPNSETYNLSYTSTGLLLTFQNPNGVTSTMIYDDKGNLLSDISEAGSSLLFSKSDGRNSKIITQNSALSRQTLHTINNTDGNYQRVDRFPNGFNKNYFFQPEDNFTSVSQSNSVSNNSYFTSDARFPSAKMTTVANFNDAGRNMATSYQELVSPTNIQDPFSFNSLIKIWSINSKNFKSTFTKNTNTEIFETPLGRKVTTIKNSLNDPSSIQVSNFAPINVNYNLDGSISSLIQDDRTTSYT